MILILVLRVGILTEKLHKSHLPLSLQNCMENVYSETYSLLIQINVKCRYMRCHMDQTWVDAST